MSGRVPARLLAAVAAAAVVAAGCSSNSGPEPDADGPADQVTYLTGFGETAREVYARVADEKGFFAQANIEVTIEPGAGGDTNHTALAGGAVQFAVVDSSGAFIRYVNGEDDSFQVVAAIHQLWPMALLGYTDTGLSRPRDLNGATIGLAAGTIAERLWPTYAELTPGLEAATVQVIPTSPQTQVAELVAGQLDAIALFSVSAPGLELAGGGREVTAFAWSDALADLYGAVLITSKQLATDDPDLVGRFTTALLQGLEYTMENPAEAGRIQQEASPESGEAAVHARELELLRDFVYGGLQPTEPVGYLDDVRAARAMALLTAVGEITDDFNPALAPPDGDRSDGIINFQFVPGATR